MNPQHRPRPGTDPRRPVHRPAGDPPEYAERVTAVPPAPQHFMPPGPPIEPPFYEGDVVQLKSGGPPMTVARVIFGRDDQWGIATQWFHEFTLNAGNFYAASLELDRRHPGNAPPPPTPAPKG